MQRPANERFRAADRCVQIPVRSRGGGYCDTCVRKTQEAEDKGETWAPIVETQYEEITVPGDFEFHWLDDPRAGGRAVGGAGA